MKTSPKGDPPYSGQLDLEALLGSLPGMVYRCRNDKHWTMEYVSRGCRDLTGYYPGDLVGNRTISFANLIHPDDRERVAKTVNGSLERERRFQLTYRIVTAQNESKWVWEQGCALTSDSGHVYALQGYIMDITEMCRYADIMEHIQTGFLMYRLEDPDDDRSLILTAINPAAERLTGLSKTDVLNKPIDEVFPGLREYGIPQMFADSIRSDKPGEIDEFRYGNTRVEEAIWSFKAFPLPGNRVGVSFEDITRRKALEEQLLQAQKMEVMGSLAGGVAHDFNNFLFGITGIAQAMLDEVEPTSQMETDLQDIQAIANRAAGLTRRLLSFSRKTPEEDTVTDLDRVVNNTSTLMQVLVGKGIPVEVVQEEGPKPTSIGEVELEQVLLNLASNARDAMPEGGRITLETSTVELDHEYSFGHLDVEPGSYALLSVSDTGCGMDQETRSRVFEPFFTTKSEEKGTGLGLSTVYGILKRHNGHVWVYSEPGQGTIFKIYLPLVERELPTVEEAASFDLPQGTETVLILEDELRVLEMTHRAAVGLGYTAFAANTVEEARRIFEERGDEIDLLVTDIFLPGGQGPGLFEEFSARQESLKVLYMSGYTDKDLAERGQIPLGALYLHKPFRVATFAQKIREVLDQSS